ncbi:MAG: radical SAM protein [Candidatus Pacearchaeota archaeon]
MLFKNKFSSIYNFLPEGCRLCWKGAKMVLFVTGRCKLKCWYCPISDERKGKNVVYANERPVKNFVDALREAREMNALGMSITGGEPLLNTQIINKTLTYIRYFKKRFKPFHVHLYTYGYTINQHVLRLLENAGLDELRFHSFLPNKIKEAVKFGFNVGIETPCIPGNEKKLKEIVDFCAKISKIKQVFLNLNEFEFSETNWQEMRKHGFKPIGESYAVKGSLELGEKILQYAARKSVNAHFCSVKTKFMLQLVERLKRRVKNIKRPWQKINKYGYLVYGEVKCNKKLAEKWKVHYKGHNLAETSVEKARELAKKYKVEAWKVTLFPIYKPWIFERAKL